MEWSPPPRAPKTDFRSILDDSILHRFSQRGNDGAKRCRSPTGSTLRRSWCAKSILSLRFYCVFQRRAWRPCWGPRKATDRFVVDLGPFLESKRGPKRPKIDAKSVQHVNNLAPKRFKRPSSKVPKRYKTYAKDYFWDTRAYSRDDMGLIGTDFSPSACESILHLGFVRSSQDALKTLLRHSKTHLGFLDACFWFIRHSKM